MKWFAGFLAALSLTPLFVSAQTVDLQALLAQIQALQAQIRLTQGVTNCDLPTHTMKRGSAGDDVTHLQQFLARDKNIFPDAVISGYYGALTELAVQRWQIKNSIVTSGSPSTNGFGAVGPRTLSAMRAKWCLQAEIAPSPFASPAGPATTTPVKPPPPQLVFTAPSASSSVNKGSSIQISWQSTRSPSNAVVTLSLQTKSGVTLGIIKSGLSSIGSYYWIVPAPQQAAQSTTCLGSTIQCLAQIAQTVPDCTLFCSLTDGAYKFYAQLMLGSTELAHAESRIFSIGGVGLSAQDLANVGTTWNLVGTTSTSIGPNSYLDPVLSNTDWTSTAMAVPGQSCLYSGIPYSDGITLEVNCADVRVPGQGCGNLGGMQLSCKNGTWLDKDGVAQSVRNVTTANTAGSCLTPWGSTRVGNGNQIPRYPFFTNGEYPTSGAPLIMKCSNGNWQTCDTVGNNCR